MMANDWRRRFFTVLAIVIMIHPLTSHFYFNTIAIGFVFYSVGFEVKQLGFEKIKDWVPAIWMLLIGGLGLCCSEFLTCLNGKVSILYCSLNNPVLFSLNSIVGSLSILMIGLSLENFVKDTFVSKVSNASIGVVLTHMFFVDYLRLLRGYLPINGAVLFLFYCIAAAVVYGVCVAIYYYLNAHVPIVFGNKKIK